MSDTRKIDAARITECRSMFDAPPEVRVRLEGETEEQTLFSFFPDEISFTAAEFIGLTVEQAHSLRHRKDVAYLQG